MNTFLVVFVGLLAAANALSFFDVVREDWKAFKVIRIYKQDKSLYFLIQLTWLDVSSFAIKSYKFIHV